jgi:hypothetical protein
MFVDMEVNTCKEQNSTNSELLILTEVNFLSHTKLRAQRTLAILQENTFSTKEIVNLALVQTEL